MSRLIAIGGVHGYFSKLLGLMKELKPTGKDHFIFLGDYIGNGPQSPEVIEYLINFRKYYNSDFIMGDAESAMISCILSNYPIPDWLSPNLTSKVIQDYGGISAIPDEHAEFYKLTSPFVRVETIAGDRVYYFTHGMLSPTEQIQSQLNEAQATWGMPSKLIKKSSKWRWNQGDFLVFSHEEQQEPMFYNGNSALNIETGAGNLEGKLTAAILPKSSAGAPTFVFNNQLEAEDYFNDSQTSSGEVRPGD